MTTPGTSDSRLRRSPLADEHLACGATLAAYHGAEVPVRFRDWRSEHEAVRAAAGLFDFSFRSKFTLTGEHRVRFLHRVVSNDVKRLFTGQGTYATLLSAQGRILVDLRIYADEDRLWVDTDADLAEKAIAALKRYIIGDRVEIEPSELYTVALQGPQSRKALGELLGSSLEHLEDEMDHCAVDHEGGRARAVRLSSTGEEGYEVWLEAAAIGRFWRAARDAGGSPITACGSEALESLRIEAGVPRYGQELGEDTLPLEAGLLGALSFNKGCYVGQEIVERARTRGHVNWRLMGLCLEAGAPVPRPGESLTADAKSIGEVTSACFSPKLGRPLALAYVRREVSQPGTKLTLATGTVAEVAELPFVSRGGSPSANSTA
jgi:glycine cleavage system T protein